MSVIYKASVLFVFWLLASGTTKPFYVAVGLAGSILIGYLNRSPSSVPLRSVPALAGRSAYYACWIFYRMLTAAMHVTRLILHPKLPIAPRFITHRTVLETDIEKVIFANSITLTPGTITGDLSGNEYVIHQLDEASAGDITSGAMEKEIARIKKGPGD